MLTYRDAHADDFEFFFELIEKSLKAYVEPLWGWDETWQRNYLAERIDYAASQVIVKITKLSTEPFYELKFKSSATQRR